MAKARSGKEATDKRWRWWFLAAAVLAACAVLTACGPRIPAYDAEGNPIPDAPSSEGGIGSLIEGFGTWGIGIGCLCVLLAIPVGMFLGIKWGRTAAGCGIGLLLGGCVLTFIGAYIGWIVAVTLVGGLIGGAGWVWVERIGWVERLLRRDLDGDGLIGLKAQPVDSPAEAGGLVDEEVH